MGYFVLMSVMAVSTLVVLWFGYKSARNYEEHSHHF
jgi:formate-dependent nitrite reductase cytochrome c552 subunit